MSVQTITFKRINLSPGYLFVMLIHLDTRLGYNAEEIWAKSATKTFGELTVFLNY